MKSQYRYKKTKLLCGVGLNNADYSVIKRDKNRKITWRCPFYKSWSSMITRCYSGKQRCYTGCSVVPEWHSFLNFRDWMIGQEWEGKCLDKDILMPDNKIYSPDTCVFITQDINKLLNSQNEKRGKWPMGVSFSKVIGKFRSVIRIYGENIHLGCFETPEEAEKVYKKAKSNHVRKIAFTQKNERVKSALLLRANHLIEAYI